MSESADKKQLPKAVREYMASLGRKGKKDGVVKGVAALSKSKRAEISRKGAAARWGKPISTETPSDVK